ncbi:MAG: hypothetical protein N2645_13080 [Clostridia bacterium]|nr:hypothetical protein [Clostridia bacterium]
MDNSFINLEKQKTSIPLGAVKARGKAKTQVYSFLEYNGLYIFTSGNFIWAISAETGKKVWESNFTKEKVEFCLWGVFLYKEKLWTIGWNSHLVCIDPHQGDLLIQFKITVEKAISDVNYKDGKLYFLMETKRNVTYDDCKEVNRIRVVLCAVDLENPTEVFESDIIFYQHTKYIYTTVEGSKLILAHKGFKELWLVDPKSLKVEKTFNVNNFLEYPSIAGEIPATDKILYLDYVSNKKDYEVMEAFQYKDNQGWDKTVYGVTLIFYQSRLLTLPILPVASWADDFIQLFGQDDDLFISFNECILVMKDFKLVGKYAIPNIEFDTDQCKDNLTQGEAIESDMSTCYYILDACRDKLTLLHNIRFYDLEELQMGCPSDSIIGVIIYDFDVNSGSVQTLGKPFMVGPLGDIKYVKNKNRLILLSERRYYVIEGDS